MSSKPTGLKRNALTIYSHTCVNTCRDDCHCSITTLHEIVRVRCVGLNESEGNIKLHHVPMC